MRILVVNVNTTESMTASIAATARSVAAPGTEIVGLTPPFGAESVEGNYESHLAAIAVMETVKAYTEPYDAIIQAGYGERGREGLQELFEVPVVEEAARAVTEDRAEVICLGCGGMAGLADEVRARAGVPVVDGVGAAVTIAEGLVRMGLRTSKIRTYAPPGPKAFTNWPPR